MDPVQVTDQMRLIGVGPGAQVARPGRIRKKVA